MNPRDTDALYYALLTKTKDFFDSQEAHHKFTRELLSEWEVTQDDDTRYADEHAWVKDIFESNPTCWTEERDKHPGFAPRRSRHHNRNEELQVGDTTQLDSFLAGFTK